MGFQHSMAAAKPRQSFMIEDDYLAGYALNRDEMFAL